MDEPGHQEFIRQQAKRNRDAPGRDLVLWSRHAVAKLAIEGLSRQQVEDALTTCEIVEAYPAQRRPLPDCLVLSTLSAGEALHAVVAVDAEHDRILVVTLYRPDPRRWENDWRTRRT